jgi:uncharacterized membrane protein YgcG
VPRPQRLAFERLLREDPERGLVELARGSLEAVDRWDLVDDRTLRWRSRAPADPEFDGTELVYVLEYVLSNVLVPEGEGRFRLDHDLAFPDRDWPIEAFTGRVELDPSWQAEPGAALALARRGLPPGEGAVARVALRWVAAGPAPGPAAPGLPPPLRPALAAWLAAALAVAVGGVLRHGRARGLFSRAVDPSAVDADWLRAHVLAHPAEVVGAAWDGTIGAPEVAAVLARMAAEGKLDARVEAARRWYGGKDETLHLTLRVKRGALAGNERALVDALFVAGDRIDSRALRRHYEGEGFDPAAEVRDRIELAVARLVPEGDPPSRWAWLPMGAFLVAGLALALAEALRGDDPAPVVASVFVAALLLVLPTGAAHVFAERVERHVAPALAAIALLLAWASAVGWLAWGGAELGGRIVLAHASLFTFGALAVARRACTRTSPQGIAVRKRLAAARAHFARQLRSDRPALDDAWTPYLVALGLGPEMDRWFRGHAAEGAPAIAAGGGAATGGGSGVGWSGGGGRFSGGGAGGTWAAFAGLATAIPSPSSGSSDGGGGGGGSSSGGGGGGGW